ncbi:MAG: hypothetical protein OHK0037_21040 [Elainellaceae cyanobacterium]
MQRILWLSLGAKHHKQAESSDRSCLSLSQALTMLTERHKQQASKRSKLMARHNAKMWQIELDDLMRGIAGGFLFGAPFLYTMEV